VFTLAAFSQGTYRYRRNAHTRKLDLVYIQSVSGGGWTEDGDTTSTTLLVGIGTTAPAYSLDINGAINVNDYYLNTYLVIEDGANHIIFGNTGFYNTAAYGLGGTYYGVNIDGVDYLHLTAIIIAAQVALGDDGNTYAARMCAEYQATEGGKTYGDWYLPSKEELNLMYLNKAAIDATATANGGSAFASAYYWSSTENNANNVWVWTFGMGYQVSSSKLDATMVRAVRAL